MYIIHIQPRIYIMCVLEKNAFWGVMRPKYLPCFIMYIVEAKNLNTVV